MTSSLPRRAITLSAACLLELLLVLALVRSLRSAPPAPTTVLVFVSRGQLLRSAPAPASAAPVASARGGRPAAGFGRGLLPQAPTPDLRSLQAPSASFPPASPSARTPLDWAGAAREAAADAAGRALLTRQRLAAMDELPDDRQQRTHAGFPWSHQPRTPWLEFDAHTLTSSLHLGKHCELVLFVILPGFACLLGHLDDESRGDLFDPALLPAPLQLPSPLLPAVHKPWSATGPDAAMP